MKKHIVLEVTNTGICESEGKAWLYYCPADEWPKELNWSDVSYQVFNQLNNVEIGDSIIFKAIKVTDKEWKAAVKRGEELA